MPGCPLSLEALPRPLHKHVDPKAPAPLRMMAAKGLVPAVAAGDLVTMLFMLTFDGDENVRATSAKTAEGIPEKIWGAALRAEGVKGEVLDWLADRFAGKDAALELLLLNSSTPDATVARLAPAVSQKLVEIVRQNELRLLRHDDIIRSLCRNPSALASTVDGACDFCVRNGVKLFDVPQIVEAYQRVHGVDPTATPPAPEETAGGLIAEFHGELGEERGEEGRPPETAEEERKKLTITQRILRMSVSEKIKLATLGNKEARTLLLRDANKLVCMAAVTSPRITEGEIMTLANSKTTNAEVLRHIYGNRELLRNYGLKLSLVKNPKVPLPTALRFLQTLQERDIKELARDRNVPNTIQAQAKAWMMKKEAASKPKAGGKP